MVTARQLEPAPDLQVVRPTANAMVLEYLRRQYADVDRVDAPSVADEVRAKFGADQSFVEALANEFFHITIYQIVRNWLTTTRRPTHQRQLAERSPLAVVLTRPSRNWSKFMEHTGNAYVRVMQMTRAELLQAAATRRARASVEVGYANTWERLAERLRRDDERVCDRWSVEEIADVYAANGVTDEEQAAA